MLEIIVLPDKQLRLVSKPIEKVTPEIRKLADDMLETMYAAPGIGLAGIQVAQPLRIITMDLAKRDEEGETQPRPPISVASASSQRGRLAPTARRFHASGAGAACAAASKCADRPVPAASRSSNARVRSGYLR